MCCKLQLASVQGEDMVREQSFFDASLAVHKVYPNQIACGEVQGVYIYRWRMSIGGRHNSKVLVASGI